VPGVLVAAALISGAFAWVVGHAFVAPSHSFLRSRSGGIVLALCVLGALFAPTVAGWLAGTTADGDGALGRTAWIVAVGAGLLAGVRVWRLRLLSGGGGLFTLDESPVSRVESQLPLAGSLADALDVLARERCTERDLSRIEGALKRIALRYSHQMPGRKSEVYALVASHVPTTISAEVTRLLLEGSGRRFG
jgi:MFS family permease